MTLIPNWRNKEMFNILGGYAASGKRIVFCKKGNYFKITKK
jgi:hypothetical protein